MNQYGTVTSLRNPMSLFTYQESRTLKSDHMFTNIVLERLLALISISSSRIFKS
ncbi:hypothetical protein PRUPE_4G098000 [Prunus persica]|uniref:Uncharacterized protein n=1 Tax=Prunus persica TaxID=3760 RepID=A0A251PI69_PRUPE|nr:hypothetical protein PRUPE_4G098000 [Prunus persica]